MDKNLAGRVALVTGGSRGIGRATCLALATRGAAVAVLCRSRLDQAKEVVQQIQAGGERALAIQADVLDPGAIKRSVQEAVSGLGRIDILVNNLGEMTGAPVADMKDEEWEHSLAVNLGSAFRYARECIPSMKERRWGRIINVSSQAAFTGSNNHAHYAAAKSGLLGLNIFPGEGTGRVWSHGKRGGAGANRHRHALRRHGRARGGMDSPNSPPAFRPAGRGGWAYSVPGLGRRQLYYRCGA